MRLIVNSGHYGLPIAVLPVLPLAVGAIAWLAITRRTGLALAIVLLYLGLVDGVVKLKSGGQGATLGRDVLLYAVAVGMAVRARGPFRMPALGGWVVAWIVIAVVQLANPGNSSMSHAVASLRQDLEFVPLFFIGFVALRTHASLHAFFALLLGGRCDQRSRRRIPGLAVATPAVCLGARLRELLSVPTGQGRVCLLAPTGSCESGRPAWVRTRASAASRSLGASWRDCLLITYRRRRWLLALIVLGLIGAVVGVLTSEVRDISHHGRRRSRSYSGASRRWETGQAFAIGTVPGCCDGH